MSFWSEETVKDSPYPWVDLFTGLAIIAFVIVVFLLTKDGDDVITTAMRMILYLVEKLLASVFRTCLHLAHHSLYYYWLPLGVVLVTWYLFPDIVDDFLFLIYLGLKRYKTLFF